MVFWQWVAVLAPVVAVAGCDRPIAGTALPGRRAATIGGGGMFGSCDADSGTDCATQPPTPVPGAVTFEMPSAANGVAID